MIAFSWREKSRINVGLGNKSFTVQQTHENLVIFYDDSHRIVGFNFYDTTEAESFCKSLEMLKNNKRDTKKKFSFRGMFSSSKKEKELEIGKPTDFKHLQHVGLDMTADQEELYNRILPGLKMKENGDIALKEFVIRNEDKLRQSIMKDKKKTPKTVKKGTFFKSKKIEENLQPKAPPAFPSRSASRVSPSLSPRLPSHRQSYQWATNPVETVPPSPKPEIQATRVAPPPPPIPTSAPKVALPPVNPPSVAPPRAPPLPSDGFKIRKVEPDPESEEEEEELEVEEAANPRKTSSISNERRSFLDEIQNVDKSKILRKVSEDRHSITTPTGENTMIDAIQQFLDARRVGINPSDSEDSDDEDDWSDLICKFSRKKCNKLK
ncbi:unnamed protein product [Caenorhabditis angaria]|uniref:CRIB domain-containing protein n=1 Tax=Caenorhabditis angaria TaxID=860376 RepID=A0A9P1IIT7_9PELO|nr:unnamed protein product [Caenorhabditis angaria]